MNVIETVKVSSRGQIVIPESIREDLAIEEGTKLILVEENGKITLEKEEQFLKELKKKRMTDEEIFRRLGEESLARALDNPKDNEAAKWYAEQYKKGAYDELNKPSKK